MGLRSKTEHEKEQVVIPAKSSAASYEQPRHYHDESVELDAIERLKSNILMLDDLQNRLRFMNNELESIIGSKKKF